MNIHDKKAEKIVNFLDDGCRYLVSCLRFINSFVNTPPELDLRIRLRSEFVNQGLDVVLQSSFSLSPEVDKQINNFNDMMEEDHKELDELFSDVDIRYHILQVTHVKIRLMIYKRSDRRNPQNRCSNAEQ